MPQRSTPTAPTRGATATPIMPTRRRGRRARHKMTESNTTGIAFTTQSTRRGETNFGTVAAEVLDQYRNRLTGPDLALTLNLIHAAWQSGPRS